MRPTNLLCLLAALALPGAGAHAQSLAEAISGVERGARRPAGRAAPAAAAGGSVKAVAVDCAAGESINAALAKKADELIVEITGLCAEDVQVRRDRVTLRGSDPLVDGIQAVGTGDLFGAALLIREARFVTVENLKLTGGVRAGLRVENARRNVFATNCRFEGNGFWGVVAIGSLVDIDDSVATGNGSGGLIASESSFILCDNCTVFDNPAPGEGIGVISSLASSLTFVGGSVAAQIAADVEASSFGNFRDTTLIAEDLPSGVGFAVFAEDDGNVNVRTSTIDGSLLIEDQAQIFLISSDQVGNPLGNLIGTQAKIETRGSPTTGDTNLVGLTLLSQWANGVFSPQTNLGDLGCSTGADALCTAGVTKTSSTCALCP